MASCVIVPSAPNYVLTLSEDEAQFLRDLTSAIGGDPATTRRCFSDNIRGALDVAGVYRSKLHDLDDSFYMQESKHED